MVVDIRTAEMAIGEVVYPTDVNRAFSRSLYVTADIKRGELITEQNVRSVRPGFGLHPKYLKEIIGRKVNRDLRRGERMSLSFI